MTRHSIHRIITESKNNWTWTVECKLTTQY
jgi:hypothetical protein